MSKIKNPIKNPINIPTNNNPINNPTNNNPVNNPVNNPINNLNDKLAFSRTILNNRSRRRQADSTKGAHRSMYPPWGRRAPLCVQLEHPSTSHPYKDWPRMNGPPKTWSRCMDVKKNSNPT
jgi:hypothetical protein